MLFRKKNDADSALAADTSGHSSGFMGVVRGLVAALLILFVASLSFALLLAKTELPADTLNLLHYVVLAVAFLVGGIVVGRRCGRKGLVHGLALAIVFLLISLICSLKLGDISWLAFGFKGLIVILSSAIGGIIGVK